MENTDFEIRNLADTSFEDICTAFLDAFADYGMTLDKVSLSAMLKRRGARMDLSFAAFDNDRIVSFIINGIGNFRGRTMAYDTGTGTIKEYRGLKLTDRIFAFAAHNLAKAGIESYILEVLTDNTPAVKIYTRQGFEIAREFDCYKGETSEIIGKLACRSNESVEIAAIPAEDIESYSRFFDFEPSWQNSIESIKRNSEAFVCLQEKKGPEVVGIAVSEAAYGDITLLAVSQEHRREGIGSRLLFELMKRNKLSTAKILNVEHGCKSMAEFALAAGFALSCTQYEMIKKI